MSTINQSIISSKIASEIASEISSVQHNDARQSLASTLLVRGRRRLNEREAVRLMTLTAIGLTLAACNSSVGREFEKPLAKPLISTVDGQSSSSTDPLSNDGAIIIKQNKPIVELQGNPGEKIKLFGQNGISGEKIEFGEVIINSQGRGLLEITQPLIDGLWEFTIDTTSQLDGGFIRQMVVIDTQAPIVDPENGVTVDLINKPAGERTLDNVDEFEGVVVRNIPLDSIVTVLIGDEEFDDLIPNASGEVFVRTDAETVGLTPDSNIGVDVILRDEAGNQVAISGSFFVIEDKANEPVVVNPYGLGTPKGGDIDLPYDYIKTDSDLDVTVKARAGDEVELQRLSPTGVVVETFTKVADEDGLLHFNVSDNISDGVYLFRAKVKSSIDGKERLSDSVAALVDTQGPQVIPTIEGISSPDHGIAVDQPQEITGLRFSGGEPLSRVNITMPNGETLGTYLDENGAGVITFDGDGSLYGLKAGDENNLYVATIDMLGNDGVTRSAELPLRVIDPNFQPEIDLRHRSDTGFSNVDRITKAEPITLHLMLPVVDGLFVEATRASDQAMLTIPVTAINPDGSAELDVDLADGSWLFEVKVGDKVAAVNVVKDSQAPQLPTVVIQGKPGLQAENPDVVYGLVLSNGEAGARVEITGPDGVVYVTILDVEGNALIELPQSVRDLLPRDSRVDFPISATDIAGNVSSGTVTIEVAPFAGLDLDLRASSDTGQRDDDNVTSAKDLVLDLMVPYAESATLVATRNADGVQVSIPVAPSNERGETTAVAKESEGLTDGVWTFRLTVSGEFTKDLVITKDSTSPREPSPVTIDGDTDLTASAADDVTGLRFRNGEPGTTVAVTAPDGNVYEALFDAQGDAVVVLPEGARLFEAGETALPALVRDKAGNETPLDDVIITINPRPLILSLDPDSDTGIDPTDGITNADELVFNLSGPANVMVTVEGKRINDTLPRLGPITVVTDSQGQGTLVLSGVDGLTDGEWTFTAMHDGATSEVPVTRDTTPPIVPTVTIDGDNDLTAAHPADVTGLRFKGGEADVLVSIKAPNGVVYSTTLDANGEGLIPLPQDARGFIYDQTANLDLTLTDKAGNTNKDTLVVPVMIDPLTEAALDLVAASDTGVSSTDNLTKATDLVLDVMGKKNGTAVLEAVRASDGAMVTVAIPTLDANGEGMVTVTQASGLTDGTWTFTVTSDGVSASLDIVKDTMLPVGAIAIEGQTGLTAPTANAVTGLTISGGEAGSTYTVKGTDGADYSATLDTNGAGVIAIPAGARGFTAGQTTALALKVVDAAGNEVTQNVSITVEEPTVAALDLVAASDTGVSSTDNLTNATDLVLDVMGKKNGTAVLEAVRASDGAMVTVAIPTLDANGEGMVTVTQASGLTDGTWTFTVTSDGVSASLDIVKDTMLPVGAIAIEGQTDLTAPTANAVTGLTISGGEAGSTYTVKGTDGADYSATLDTNGAGVIALPAGARGFTAGQTTALALKVVDAAGNEVTQNVSITVEEPTVAALDLVAASDTGVSSTDNLTKATDLVLDVMGKKNGTAVLEAVRASDGAMVTVAIPTLDANGEGMVTVTQASGLTDGTWTFTVTSDGVSASLDIVKDTMLPVGAIAIEGQTGLTAPTANAVTGLTISGGEAGSTYTVKGTDGADYSATLDTNGAGVIAIPAGARGFTAGQTTALALKVVDAAGNEVTQNVSITVEEPTVAALDLVAASDTGVSSTDNLTNATDLVLDVMGKKNGTAVLEAVRASDGAMVTVAIPTLDANGEGMVTVTQASGLTDGTWTFTVTSDGVSASLDIVKDTMLPVGAIAIEGQTDLTAPTANAVTGLTISGGEAGSTYTVKGTDGADYSATLDTNGAGVIALPAGARGFTAGQTTALALKVVDAAGNEVTQNVSITVEEPTVAALDLVAASDTGVSSTDNLTNATDLVLDVMGKKNGTAVLEAVRASDGAMVTVAIPTLDANGEGMVTVTQASGLTDGTWTFTVTSDGVSASLDIVKDTMLPVGAIAIEGQAGLTAPTANAVTGLTISGGEAGSTYTVKGTDGADYSATLDTNGAGVIAIPAGARGFTAGQTTALALKVVDAAGNEVTQNVSITVEEPTVAALDLVAASDTGVSSTDNLTNATDLVLDVMGKKNGTAVLEAVRASDGAMVTVAIPTLDANGEGMVTVTQASGLTDGTWTFTVTSDGVSASLDIVKDTMLPVGAIAIEGQTDLTAPTANAVTGLTISGGEAGSTYTVKGTDGADYSATLDTNGAGVIAIPAGARGFTAGQTTALALKVVDAAGNEVTQNVSITVEEPTVAALDLVAASDTGVSSTDNLTNATDLVLDVMGKKNGTAVLEAVRASDGAMVTVAIPTLDANGEGMVTVTEASGLTDGTWTFTVTSGGASASLDIVKDTVVNAGKVTLQGQNNLWAPQVSSVTGFTIRGGEANGTYSVRGTDYRLYSTTLDAYGDGLITLPESARKLFHGENKSYVLMVTDAAGNENDDVNLIVEVAGFANYMLSLDFSSDTGTSTSDRITKLEEFRVLATLPVGAKTKLLAYYDANQQFITLDTSATPVGRFGLETFFNVQDGFVEGLWWVTFDTLNRQVIPITIDRTLPEIGELKLALVTSGEKTTDLMQPTVMISELEGFEFTGKYNEQIELRLPDGNLHFLVIPKSGKLYFALPAELKNETYFPAGRAVSLDYRHSDVAGNPSVGSFQVSIGSSDAMLVALDLAPQSDNGVSSSDNLTFAMDLVFKVKGESNGTAVLEAERASDGAMLTVAVPTLDAEGKATVTVTEAEGLTDGTWTFSLTSGGVTSTLEVTKDISAVEKPVITIEGHSGLTAINAADITGFAIRGGQEGVTYKVTSTDGLEYSTTLDANGEGVIALPDTARGFVHGLTKALTFKVVDTAGVESTENLNVKVEAFGDYALSVLSASDTGFSNRDRVTNAKAIDVVVTLPAGVKTDLFAVRDTHGTVVFGRRIDLDTSDVAVGSNGKLQLTLREEDGFTDGNWWIGFDTLRDFQLSPLTIDRTAPTAEDLGVYLMAAGQSTKILTQPTLMASDLQTLEFVAGQDDVLKVTLPDGSQSSITFGATGKATLTLPTALLNETYFPAGQTVTIAYDHTDRAGNVYTGSFDLRIGATALIAASEELVQSSEAEVFNIEALTAPANAFISDDIQSLDHADEFDALGVTAGTQDHLWS